MSIRTTERETYESMWAMAGYRQHSPGVTYVPLFLDMATPDRTATVLDAGCGAGDGALALVCAGFSDVRLCDIVDVREDPAASALSFSQACLWEPLAPTLGYLKGRQVDWVYCCDVLEHVPTPFTMLVVSRLLEVARRGVFLSISLMPDQFGAWIGKPLHQTVQTFPAWLEQLNEVGRVKEARDLLHCGVFIVEAK